MVLVGNNTSCKVTVFGSMILRIVNGWRLTLIRMRHVPALGKNMISLGILDDFGYHDVFSKGELSIYKGSELVLKGIKRNTLYVLRVLHCLGDDLDLPDDAWSYREEGMQLLSKRDLPS